MYRKRKVMPIVLLLLIIALITTGISLYAYIKDVQKKNHIYIEFAEETTEINIELKSSETRALVPINHVKNQETETDVILFQFEVSLTNYRRQHQLLVETTNIYIEEISNKTFSHLINVSVDGTNNTNTYDILGAKIVVKIEIRLNEPLDAKEYEGVAGKEAIINLRFKIEPKA